MSRITAPVAKLSRSLNTASTRSAPLLDSHRNAGAALMPKYQELLHGRTRRIAEHSDSSRHLYTHHAPRPQPSIAHRKKPLMQTFHTTTASKTPTSHMDAAVLPRLHESSAPEPEIYMPLLPDNYGAFHILETAELKAPTATILAANPENVVPGAPMASIETVNLDGVELKFAHEDSAATTQQENERGFLGDIFRGMVDDVFGAPQKKTN